MPSIGFYIDNGGVAVQNLSGSGLGFYGDAGFGASVLVGEYNGRTFATSANGVIQSAEADNVKFTASNSGVLGQTGSGTNLLNIPNKDATLNVKFTHSTAVQVQNVVARIYDRVNINNGASGVTTKIAELIHPWPEQPGLGSGDSTWHSINAGVASSVYLANSPGENGNYAGNGSNSVRPDTTHDWFLALSASPDSIGSKLFGIYISMEYL